MSKPSAIVVGVGAERGLGAALCRRFAQGGCHVLIAGRTPAKIDKVAETIVSAGGSAEPIAMDATREEDVARLFDRAMAPGDGFAPADLVASNAGNKSTHRFPRADGAAVRGFLARRLLQRIPGRARGGAPARAASVPVPTFVSLCSTRSYERRNQRDTSNHRILVWLWI